MFIVFLSSYIILHELWCCKLHFLLWAYLGSFFILFCSLSKTFMKWWWAKHTICKYLMLLFNSICCCLPWAVLVLYLWHCSTLFVICIKCHLDTIISDMFTSSPLQRVNGIQSENDKLGRIMLEKNGITLNFPPGVVSSDQITAIQVPFYWLSPILCCLRIEYLYLHMVLCRKLTGV